MRKRHNSSFGLTFLETMFVATLFIIGVIIVASAFNDIKERARDSRRVSDISQIEKALNIYYAGTNRFPISPDEITITGEDTVSKTLTDELAIKKMPTDPLHPVLTYRYVSNEDGSDYRLTFCLETENIPEHERGCDNHVGP